MDWNQVSELLESGRRDGLYACYGLAAGRNDSPTRLQGGWAQREPEPRKLDERPIFDLGSLTKVICTTMLTMQAVEQGVLGLDQSVAEMWPGFGARWARDVTLRHLLSHSAGLAATRPYYETLQGADDILARVGFDPLDATPGRMTIYSDLGFMLLGRILELRLGGRLDRLFEERVAGPLGLEETFFAPLRAGKPAPAQDLERFVATHRCRWRGRVLVAEVHDPNAWAMGGVAGHAGLFGTARDLYRFGRLVAQSWNGHGPLDAELTRLFARKAGVVHGSDRALGWDTPTPGASSSGARFSADAVGHLGYVGTSLWIDLPSQTVIVLLTNRLHPDDTVASRRALRAFRPGIHDAIWEAIEGT